MPLWSRDNHEKITFQKRLTCCCRKCSRQNESEWKYNSSYYIEYYFFTSYDGYIRLQFVILYNTHTVFLYTVNIVVLIMRTPNTPVIFVNGLNKSEETWYAHYRPTRLSVATKWVHC